MAGFYDHALATAGDRWSRGSGEGYLRPGGRPLMTTISTAGDFQTQAVQDLRCITAGWLAKLNSAKLFNDAAQQLIRRRSNSSGCSHLIVGLLLQE
jgi:hypothetical protein